MQKQSRLFSQRSTRKRYLPSTSDQCLGAHAQHTGQHGLTPWRFARLPLRALLVHARQPRQIDAPTVLGSYRTSSHTLMKVLDAVLGIDMEPSLMSGENPS